MHVKRVDDLGVGGHAAVLCYLNGYGRANILNQLILYLDLKSTDTSLTRTKRS